MEQLLLFAVGALVFLISGVGTVVALVADRNQPAEDVRRHIDDVPDEQRREAKVIRLVRDLEAA